MMEVYLTNDEMQELMRLIHDEIEWWNNSRADSLQKYYEASKPNEIDFQDWLHKTTRVHDLEDLLCNICSAFNDEI